MLLSEILTFVEDEQLLTCIKELNSIGIKTTKDFLDTHYLNIYFNNKQLNLESIKFINNHLKTNYNKNQKLTNGRILLDKEFNIDFISTGFINLDALLEGGLYSNKIYEIIGLPGVGKTQLSINIALNYLINNPNSKILWIQFGNNFPLNLILKLLESRLNTTNEDNINYELNEVNNNDKFEEIMNRFNLLEVNDITYNLNQIKQTYSDKLSLVIIDNISLNITLNLNSQQIGIGQRSLVNFVNELRSFACHYNCPIILNSLGRYILDKTSIEKFGQVQPRFGTTWSYLSDLQIILYKISQSSKKYFNIDDFDDPLMDITDEFSLDSEDLNPWLRCYILKNKYGASNVSCEINLKSKTY